MKSILMSLSCTTVAFLNFVPALAADGHGAFVTMGAGNSSCGKWVEERRTNSVGAKLFESWMQGYVTAVNELLWKKSSNIADGTDADGLRAWMDAYCAAHPLEKIGTATAMLVVELSNRHQIKD